MRRPNHYHKGYTRDEQLAANRANDNRRNAARRDADVRTKEVIVWDGEGMKLSGEDKPQHYVLFGCSARPDDPLVITQPRGRLMFEELADYCISVAAAHPNAIHLGYFFQYDQNMIIWSLPWPAKLAIYHKNACRITRNGKKYFIKLIPGKTLRITRISGDAKASILIEDIAHFFGTKFTDAYESLFPTPLDPDNWAIVVEGKKLRADMLYKDMPQVRRYWRAEIIALQELATEFRKLMFDGGFMLTEWYGPGALANYIRRRHNLVVHERGGKEEHMPPAVHEASKGAFYGGHIEQFKVGVIKGPIYQYDRNSAYPSAFCNIPSLSEGGEWRRVGAVSAAEWWNRAELRNRFSVFRVRWNGRTSNPEFSHANTLIQPLPHRSRRGVITYPKRTEGWYWTPETGVAMQMAKMGNGECEILDGWTWHPNEPVQFPWEELMLDLYTTRLQLKNDRNPVQMGYKLSMNSLYGKMAQRAGGKDKPPQSHTLPIAGYVTSDCRAAVMRVMRACDRDSVLTVETDGVFTTTPPDVLQRRYPGFKMSNKLGDWSMKVLDEMIVVQNGVYLTRVGDEWQPPKSRGIPAKAMNRDAILDHFRQCTGTRWPSLTFTNKEAFLGLGASISRATHKNKWGRMSTNPFKASALHCTWHADPRELDVEGHGSKRAHIAKICPECKAGRSPAETAHPLTINSEADRWSAKPTDQISHSYTLPWEKEHEAEQWRLDMERQGMVEDAGGEIH
jgi:hypothetical protein